jgi:hypothetical protein
MKYFLLIGGFCGFLIAFASGVAAGNDLAYVLRNATIGCVGGALLLRGFRHLLMHQLRQATSQQVEALATSGKAVAPRA